MFKENTRQDRNRTAKGKIKFTFPRNRNQNRTKKTKKSKKKKVGQTKRVNQDVNGIVRPGMTVIIGPQTVPPPPAAVNNPPSPRLFEEVKRNPQYCVEYLPAIFRNFRESETKYAPRVDYIKDQPEITEEMRSILVDWLFDVHAKFRMQRETLFLCVNILDRFLSCVKVTKRRLQLVGITALYLASKYEEIYIPSVCDLESICAHTYSAEQILKMEKMVLTSLNFALTVVTPSQLLPIMLETTRSLPTTDKVKRMKVRKAAEYVSEFALGQLELSKFTPSKVAASCLYVSGVVVFGENFEWNQVFKYYVGYEKGELMPCVNTLVQCLESSQNQTKLSACRRKFSSEENLGVSKLVDNRLDFFLPV